MSTIKRWLANRDIDDDLRLMIWIGMIAAGIIWFLLCLVVTKTNPPPCGCLSGSGDDA